MPQQVNFLIDEGVSCGTGANSDISYLHFFFENYGLGEKHVILNADNYSGQNKNNYLLWYLCWRVFAGMHTPVTLSFLIAGHTKFSPDWCFGMFKRQFSSTKVSCLNDIANCVSKSSVSNINIPQLVGAEHCNVFVPCYDRSSFLEPYFKTMQSNKLYHHFYVSSDQPGVMFVREFSSSYPKPVQLCINSPPKSLPPIIPPSRIKC